jgi:hypothetical protein
MFDWNDQQSAEALAWLVLFVGIMVAGAVGCAIHGLNREYRQYTKWRRTHDAWRTIVEGDDRGSL